MERLGPDLQALETASSGTLDTLNNVVAWLHQEGFYAAESALLGEVESRYPDHGSQSRMGGSSSGGAIERASRQEENDVVDLAATVRVKDQKDGPAVLGSAERVVEAWRSKCTTPSASPRTEPLHLNVPPGCARPGSRSTCGDIDEYDDDDDVGFWRVPASGQELCFSTGFQSALASAFNSHGSPPGGVMRSDRIWVAGSSLSPSSSSLPLPHSRRSSLEVPRLSLGTPVVGDAQQAQLPPLPSSARTGNPSQIPCYQPSYVSPSGTSAIHHRHARGSSEPDLFSASYFASPGGKFPYAGSVGNVTSRQHSRKESVERRHAGTASWVFDRSNSAGSDAYKSLLSFLDQQSPRTQPLPLGSTEASDGETTQLDGLSPQLPASSQEGGIGRGVGTERIPMTSAPGEHGGIQSSRNDELLIGEPIAVQELSHLQGDEEDWEPEASAVELVADNSGAPRSDAPHQPDGEGLSRVSSLSESVVQDVMAEALQEMGLDEPLTRQKGSWTAEGDADAFSHNLKALKVGGDAAPKQLDKDAPLATGGGGPPPGAAKADPFSFPVTSPSEAGERAPAQLFASWPSFKNLSSPTRSIGGGMSEYGSTEADDDATPMNSARRLGRARLRTASSGSLGALSPPDPRLVGCLPRHPEAGGGISRTEGGDFELAGDTPRCGGRYGDLALYDYDEEALDEKYEMFDLRIIHRRGATGFEVTRELPLKVNDLIAGRYQILELLGQAAFSRAVQALDLKTGTLVCLKVVKNNKDYFDQSLDEIKMLRYVNAADPDDVHGILRLYDSFYFKEHLILVTELLRANLYEFSKHDREAGDGQYFTFDSIRSISRQILDSLAFLHSLGLIHADLKPENILMKSYSKCEVKVIDLGSSCFLTDRLSSYVQSRSYRAPEVILGLSYGQKIDIWSLGCILAELASGRVLFQNTSPVAILARMEGILGPMPQHMLTRGRYAHRFYTTDGRLYERHHRTGRLEFLRPKKSCLSRRVAVEDAGMLDFLASLLQLDPGRRLSAAEALQHPWLHERP